MVLRCVRGKLGSAPYMRSQYAWLDLENVPGHFLTCVWQGEDRHFFEHHGFDWEQIRTSWRASQKPGVPLRGASTITQQCARSLFLWQGRSWLRKGLEAYYTELMELMLSKRRIMELYVNVIELGDGVYGIEAGSQHHYGIPASQLTREQAVKLVLIMPNPKRLKPDELDEHFLPRQARVLERATNVVLPFPVAR